jgi:glycosyltransferase involved in cell wall biosynthesis
MLLMAWSLTCLGLRRRYAAVQVNTMPDALVFVTWPLRMLRGTRVLLDLHEPAPELYRTRAGADASPFLLKALVTLERWAIRYADHAITVNDTIRRRFIERGANPAKLDVVRNVPAEGFRAPSAAAPDPGFCLITHGTLQPRYGQDVAIRAVARLRGRIPGLHLRILGSGETGPHLHALAAGLGCGDMVSFDPPVPYAEVPMHLLKAHVGLVPLAPGPFSELCQPNKLFEYAALRIPILAARFPAIAETMDEGCVAFFTPGDDADLAARILELYHNPARRARLAEEAGRRFEAVRWSCARTEYVAIMKRMIEFPAGGGHET